MWVGKVFLGGRAIFPGYPSGMATERRILPRVCDDLIALKTSVRTRKDYRFIASSSFLLARVANAPLASRNRVDSAVVLCRRHSRLYQSFIYSLIPKGSPRRFVFLRKTLRAERLQVFSRIPTGHAGNAGSLHHGYAEVGDSDSDQPVVPACKAHGVPTEPAGSPRQFLMVPLHPVVKDTLIYKNNVATFPVV